MNKRLVIIGASGHGKVVADIAALNGYEEIVFLDDNETIKNCGKYPVVGGTKEAPAGDVFSAIGNSSIRKMMMERYADREHPVLIHPNSVIANDAIIGRGSVIMAGAVINSEVRLAEGVIVNTCASIDHDSNVGKYSHIAVGAHLCGNVKIGEETWVGAGAIVINNVNICGSCMIGASAVVIKDIDVKGTYIGVPARMKIKQEKSVQMCVCGTSIEN